MRHQFTFTQPQFRALAEVIGKVHGELEAERDEQEFLRYDESLVMSRRRRRQISARC